MCWGNFPLLLWNRVVSLGLTLANQVESIRLFPMKQNTHTQSSEVTLFGGSSKLQCSCSIGYFDQVETETDLPTLLSVFAEIYTSPSLPLDKYKLLLLCQLNFLKEKISHTVVISKTFKEMLFFIWLVLKSLI